MSDPEIRQIKHLVGTTEQFASIATPGRQGYNTSLLRTVFCYATGFFAINARKDVLETFEQGIKDSTLTEGQAVTVGANGRLLSVAYSVLAAAINAWTSVTLPVTTFAKTILTAVDAPTARALIGASSIAGSVSFETLFTGRSTVAVTNAVLSTLIPTKTFPANFWSAGKCVRGKIQMYSGHSAIISISLGGNEFANFAIPAVFRGELEFALTCETTGSTAKFAFCGTALGGSTSGTPVVGSSYFGDSTPTGAWSNNWSINTANSSDLTIQIYPSYTEDVHLVHGSLTTFTP